MCFLPFFLLLNYLLYENIVCRLRKNIQSDFGYFWLVTNYHTLLPKHIAGLEEQM
jgi:hypothetical protein